VEFKYRKDTKNSDGLFRNGEFKFVIDGNIRIMDSDESDSGWKTKKIEGIAPGHHNLVWVYTKLQKESTKELSAEISLIKVTGTDFSAKSCTPCRQGFSLPGSGKCSLCGADHYISQNEGEECKKCPEGTYSIAGSESIGECIQRPPC